MMKLAHYAIRTIDLDASSRFYTEVMGFRAGYRPPFDFPGVWLYMDGDETEFGVVHLIGIDAANPNGLQRYLGERPGAAQAGTGVMDHIAFLASDWPHMRARCIAAGVTWVKRTVPSLNLLQIFLTDPTGVTIELNYPAWEERAEAAESSRPCY
jgi:catechol 2,3-dioxygenase-like lactoylglutathione lyase family enzyme